MNNSESTQAPNVVEVPIPHVPGWRAFAIRLAKDDPLACKAIQTAHAELESRGWLAQSAILDFEHSALALKLESESEYSSITCFSALLRGYPCWISLGWVAPELRGTGIAAFGVNSVASLARAAGCTQLMAGHHVANIASSALLRGCGFKHTYSECILPLDETTRTTGTTEVEAPTDGT